MQTKMDRIKATAHTRRTCPRVHTHIFVISCTAGDGNQHQAHARRAPKRELLFPSASVSPPVRAASARRQQQGGRAHWSEARPLYEEALEVSREVLGNRHPHTLSSISNLARLLYDEGKYAEARPLVDEALAMFSYAARGTARRHNLLRLPQTENHRIATAPLRRYADLIAQRQLTAALQGQPGMPASEVEAAAARVQPMQSS